MKDTPMVTTTKTDPTHSIRHGLLPGVVHLAIDVADKSQSTAIAVLQDVRGEIRTAVEHGIELAEKVTTAGFRLARKVVQRIDDAASETLTSTERVLVGAVKSARETTQAATQLATTAASGIASA
jgi:hypothetical protein